MATVIEGSIMPSVENGTNLGQHGTTSQGNGLLSSYLSDLSGFQLFVTVLLMLIVYDQGTPRRSGISVPC